MRCTQTMGATLRMYPWAKSPFEEKGGKDACLLIRSRSVNLSFMRILRVLRSYLGFFFRHRRCFTWPGNLKHWRSGADCAVGLGLQCRCVDNCFYEPLNLSGSSIALDPWTQDELHQITVSRQVDDSRCYGQLLCENRMTVWLQWNGRAEDLGAVDCLNVPHLKKK